jgi:hypothetical protein
MSELEIRTSYAYQKLVSHDSMKDVFIKDVIYILNSLIITGIVMSYVCGSVPIYTIVQQYKRVLYCTVNTAIRNTFS